MKLNLPRESSRPRYGCIIIRFVNVTWGVVISLGEEKLTASAKSHKWAIK